ncbi:GntR family transcriptional regulator [Bordetella bronchialis]|uniref:GntR family transcriptional regulator n=1 Tax=Bordetella bronchialis TaxID=463025 RepID=UPI003D088AF8
MTGDSVAAAARAYEAIKSSIIECRYPPGSKISEAMLVEELGVGRSPIRTALTRLRSEGWIDVSPQSGSYVKALDEKEIREIFDFRLLLESHVARLAAQNIGDDRIRALNRALLQARTLESDGDDQATFDEFDRFDSMVHAAIYEAAGNTLMNNVLLNLLEKAQWLKKATSPSTPTRMKTWFKELERIVKALEARDPDLAARRITEHIGKAADFEMSLASAHGRGAKRVRAA